MRDLSADIPVRVEFGDFGNYVTKVHLPRISGWIDPWLGLAYAANLKSAVNLAFVLEAAFQKRVGMWKEPASTLPPAWTI